MKCFSCVTCVSAFCMFESLSVAQKQSDLDEISYNATFTLVLLYLCTFVPFVRFNFIFFF